MSVQSDSALIVVDNVGGGEGVGGDEEEEAMVNLKVVQPIEQWQTLKPGNVLILCYSQMKYLSISDLPLYVHFYRPGSASRFPCEAESADRSEGG